MITSIHNQQPFTHTCIYIYSHLSLSLSHSLSETVCKGAVMISSLCRNQAGRGTPFRWHGDSEWLL
ncbi:hypothetical protein Peur_031127 [Populus x canadensis]